MPSNTQEISNPTRSFGAVPRAIWVGGALLGLVTAALAGALVMRPAQTPAANAATEAPLVAAPAQPVPRLATAPSASSQHSKSAAGSTTTAPTHALTGTTPAALCASCGVVESVSTVQHKGEGTGLGAVAGGVLGGVAGHQVGGGKGKTAMTVLGAIGGGLAGNEVEKRARSETRFNVQVRMEDGSKRSFEHTESMAVGTHVFVEGTTLRVAPGTTRSDEPQMLRTSAPSGSNT